jgi:hypothetical protein
MGYFDAPALRAAHQEIGQEKGDLRPDKQENNGRDKA